MIAEANAVRDRRKIFRFANAEILFTFKKMKWGSASGKSVALA
jgi:hypothetical protein